MKILILDPHGDDWLWSAGKMKRYIKNGDTVKYVCFSLCEESLSGKYKLDDYKKEILDSLGYIGIKDINFFNYPVRHFNKHRQEILDDLIKIRNSYEPAIVFTPSTFDVHQDHSIICSESLRAFSKSTTMFGYDMPWNVLNATLNYYSELSEDDVRKKLEASLYYKSQLCKDNNCGTPVFLRALAIVRGNKINVDYAEAYEVITLRD